MSEWWEYFQEAFMTNDCPHNIRCACGKEHYSTYESCWTIDPDEVSDDEDYPKFLVPEGVSVRDFPIGTFKYNDKTYVFYCECIKRNEDLMSTWEWINRNGAGLVKLIAVIRKHNYDKHKMLLDEIRRIVE